MKNLPSQWKTSIFCLLLLNIQTSHAFSIADLWYTKDQQGTAAFHKGDFKTASEHFENPAWKGSAYYKNKNYEAALSTFQESTKEEDNNFYNQANSLAHLKRYEESIAAYDRALKINPQNKDAEYNREIVKKLLKQDKKDNKQQDQKNNPEQEQKKQDQKDKKDQEQQDQKNNKEQQKQDPQKSEEQKKQETKKAEELKKQEAKKAEKEKAQTAKIKPEDKQWLGQIPDDPGGLLKQKFLRDHAQMQK